MVVTKGPIDNPRETPFEAANEAAFESAFAAEQKQLASCTKPILIGVRHHSVALSVAMPQLLAAANPTRIFIEMPDVFQHWVEHVGNPKAVPPLALCYAGEDQVSMFPLASFSPERVAIAWAQEHNVEVVFFDTLARPADEQESPRNEMDPRFLLRWDELVESRCGGDAESIRRAGLAVGNAVRALIGPSASDLLREAHMRKLFEQHVSAGENERTVAVVGAFHCAALLPSQDHVEPPASKDTFDPDKTSLVPYARLLLDSRSGYPAGIEDPAWHGAVYDELTSGTDDALRTMSVKTVRALRERKHAVSSDASVEIVRLGQGLAKLRGTPRATRREFREAVMSATGKGNAAFNHVLDEVLIGTKRGQLAPGTPRSGLVLNIEEERRRLKLPEPGDDAKDYRLDPLRKKIDRERHLFLSQAVIAGIAYGVSQPVEGVAGLEALTRTWRVVWTPQVEASVALAALYGVTVSHAAEGRLRVLAAETEREGQLQLKQRTAFLERAFEAGLVALGGEFFERFRSRSPEDGSLAELLSTVEFYSRLTSGRVPGFEPAEHVALASAVALHSSSLLQQAELRLEGLFGSEELEDAVSLVTLALIGRSSAGMEASRSGNVSTRMAFFLKRFREDAAPLMQGAAIGVSLMLELIESDEAACFVASFVDGASTPLGRHRLDLALRGLFSGTSGVLGASPGLCEAIVGRVHALDDAAFLKRLFALRSGFGVMSAVEKDALLSFLDEHGVRLPSAGASPFDFAANLDLDLRAEAHLRSLFEGELQTHKVDRSEAMAPNTRGEPAEIDSPVFMLPERDHRLSTAERFRLILDRQVARTSIFAQGVSAAMKIPELTAGTEGMAPMIRRWSEELEKLVGKDVFEEVVAEYAPKHMGLLEHGEISARRASAELLSKLLELAGTLGSGATERLRVLIKKVAEELAKELATMVLPALRGARSPRPSRRQSGRLHLRATVDRNLHTARRIDGQLRLVPERVYFQAATDKSMQWEIIVLLDVSGSMEPSVVNTAVIASILSKVPWIDLTMLTFSTEVVDLSGVVEDPLDLLLEVVVGGGTLIGHALEVAAERVQRPKRTMLVLVSDFADGGPASKLLGAVDRLRNDGVKLLGLASIDREGKPRYETAVAQELVRHGMPVAALSPDRLAHWIKKQVTS